MRDLEFLGFGVNVFVWCVDCLVMVSMGDLVFIGGFMYKCDY